MVIDHITQLRATEAGLPAAESHPDPPLASFPLRLDWEATLPVVPESHEWPDPEKPMVAIDQTDKTAVKDLIKLAAAHGWTARMTEATGAWPSVAGRPSVQRRSIAVRLFRGMERAVAVYVEDATGKTWSWMDLYRWEDGTFPDLDATIGQFQDNLFGRPCRLSWPTGWALPYFGPLHGPARPPRAKREK